MTPKHKGIEICHACNSGIAPPPLEDIPDYPNCTSTQTRCRCGIVHYAEVMRMPDGQIAVAIASIANVTDLLPELIRRLTSRPDHSPSPQGAMPTPMAKRFEVPSPSVN